MTRAQVGLAAIAIVVAAAYFGWRALHRPRVDSLDPAERAAALEVLAESGDEERIAPAFVAAIERLAAPDWKTATPAELDAIGRAGWRARRAPICSRPSTWPPRPRSIRS